MPNSRLDPPPRIAGEWRANLRRDVGDASRLRCLLAAAEALPSIADPALARQHLLGAALALHAARDGVVLGLRGGRWQVLAAEGRALPPGASLPGGWPGAPADVIAARATRTIDWWMGAQAPMQMIEAAIAMGGETLGVVSIAIAMEAPCHDDDRRALGVLAAMLAAHVTPTTPAPRRARRSADPRLARLTRRERQVLALLPRGLTNAALADELGIAPGTAKVHVERILHKLALADRTQAAVFAMRQGVAT